MLRGLPASGKSTYAKELVTKQGYKRVNKDSLREMVDGGKWTNVKEYFIGRTERRIAEYFLNENFDVVVDDTNFGLNEMKWKSISEKCNAEFQIKDFDTPVQECVRRNLLRGEPVPTDAIWKMYRQHIQPEIKKVPYNKDLPDAYIFDIDGTLAHMKNRSPFEWDRVGEDSLDENVAHILDSVAGKHILIVSGRDEVCKQQTIGWMNDNSISFTRLLMRPAGDNRPDQDVKREIYENNIKGKYNVLGVFDDRDSVVQLWRSLGLKCFQCEYGSF